MMENLKSNPKISVIVPVYNSEKYLYRCLNSIINQTYKNFEVIIINDGSTDSSIEIIKEFADKYTNFHFLNQENKGVSYSKNLAIKLAKGEYISFIDSDDFVSKDFLERLYTSACLNNSDIACCEYYSYYSQQRKFHNKMFSLKKELYNNEELLKILLYDVIIHFYTWNKLFKKSLFEDNEIEFPTMCFEDIIVTVKLFYYAKKISIIRKPCYYYVIREGSLVNTISRSQLKDYLKSILLLRSFLEETNVFKNYKSSYSFYAIRAMFINTKLIFYIHTKEKSFNQIFKDTYKINRTVAHTMSKNFKQFKSNEEISDFIETLK